MSVHHILIVYGSSYGQTAKISERMGRLLTELGHDVTLMRGDRRPWDIGIDAYDGVIVGASVIGGKHQGYIEQFVRQHRDALNAMPSAFFSVSGSAASPEASGQAEARRCLDAFLKKTGWRASRTATIAGAMAYTKYGPLLRFLIRMVARRRGGPTGTSRDHEYTDWVQVERFVTEFLATLPRTPVAGPSPAPA